MNRIWKVAIAALMLLAFGGVAAGIVAAQTGGTATPTQDGATATEPSATATDSTPSDDGATTKREEMVQNFLAKLAANLGVSQSNLEEAIRATDSQILDELVADGTISQEVADRLQERIDSGDFPLFPFLGHDRGPGRGHGGPDHHFGFGLMGGDLIKQTADFLGVDRQTVIDGLQNGQSLAQIAEANGQSADALSAYVNDQLTSQLDEAVANNRITQERADSMLSNAKEHIDAAINRVGPFGGPWGGDKPLDDGTLDPSSL